MPLGLPASRRERAWLGVFLGAAALYVALTVHAARVETPTVDEFAHMPAGANYWKSGRFDLYAKNPPAAKLWMSLPIALDGTVRIPRQESSNYAWGPWDYGAAFMNANRGRYLDLFFRARLMIVILGLATGAIVLWWARRLGSRPTAAVIASLFLLSPTLLAHAHLATIDVACAFTVLLALVAIRSAVRNAGMRRAALAGAAIGMASAVKFTALLLFPAALILFLWPDAERPSRGPRGMLRDLTVIVLAALLAINLLMVFSGSFIPIGRYPFVSHFMQEVQHRLPEWLPVPLPRAYLRGFDAQKLDVESGEFGNYLGGRWSPNGFWYYNLFALLVKEPESLLIPLLLAPWFWWQRRGARRGEARFLVVPAAVLLLSLAVLNRLDAGIRYILPVLPLLYLLTGPVIEAAWSARRRRIAAFAAPALIVYAAATAITVHPGFLGYFNPASGGPSRGSRLLLDSNIDWGQDLYRVAPLARSLAPGETLGLLYFGEADPALYGIRYFVVPREPVRGLLAVSVNFVKGYPYAIRQPDGTRGAVLADHLAWLRDRAPVARLGSIWVYDTR